MGRRGGGVPGGLAEDGLSGRRRRLLRGGLAGRGRGRRHRRRMAAGGSDAPAGTEVGFSLACFSSFPVRGGGRGLPDKPLGRSVAREMGWPM